MKKILVLITIVINLFVTAGLNAKETDKKSVEFLNTQLSSKKLPFSEAVRVGNMLFLSGQIGIDKKAKKLVSGGIKAEADQTLKNIETTLKKYGYTMKDVVKCMVLLTDIGDFQSFNEVYTSYFSPPYPVRSAFAVKSLALNSTVEVECVAAVN